MYRYKRGIGNIDDAKKVEFSISNNLETYLYLNSCFQNHKPFEGYYIKKNKMLVKNIFEKIEIGKSEYIIGYLDKESNKNICEEYITAIDLSESSIEYDIGQVQYKKKVGFVEHENLLYIEYTITNNSKSRIKFKVSPCLTYRDLMETKKSKILKFNNRVVDGGVLVNLSVTNQENIALKSDLAKFKLEPTYLTDVGYGNLGRAESDNLYSDDLYIPGSFVVSVDKNDTKKIGIYINDVDFKIDEYIISDKLSSEKSRKEKIAQKIQEEYVELRDLALTIDNLSFENLTLDKLPKTDEIDIIAATNILKSIEGQYLIIENSNEAYRTLKQIFKYILKLNEDISINKTMDFVLLKLWYVESSNRVIQKVKDDQIKKSCINKIVLIMEEFIEDNVYEKDYKNNIAFVSLWFNALKIYESLLTEDKKEAIELIILYEKARRDIENKFWLEDKRIMKNNLDEEESIANIEMLLTLSLSYQCVSGLIPTKLLDTIFKELYTPYGLREFSKNSSKNIGLIYPKYMAQFVNANLRQNGVTRATQKIAYNMVKELILDIGKYINGGVKMVYHEKGLNVDDGFYDLLTNAEVIRLYDMLT